MSASNKSWLMLGGLAIAVAGVIFATKQLDGGPAPTAEIATTTLTRQTSPAAPSRTHFPTILRAKPVTDAEPAASPRYAPRDAPRDAPRAAPRDGTVPLDNPQFNQGPVGNYPLPTSAAPTTLRQPNGAASPAFSAPPGLSAPPRSGELPGSRESPAIDKATTQPDVSALETGRTGATNVPTTYVTMADDSFWKISKRIYGGEGRFFKALYYHNRNRVVRPDQIPAGVEIDTPTLAELQRLYPDLCGLGQRH